MDAKCVETVNLNWQQKRSEVREKSLKSKYVRESLQSLNDTDVLLKLESILKHQKTFVEHAQGLRAVQEHLTYGSGYLTLKESHDIYSSFFKSSCCDRQAFRDKLLDPDRGLNVYLITEPITGIIFVVSKNSTNMWKFLAEFTDKVDEEASKSPIGLGIDRDTMAKLIKSMDSEYDRNVLRTVLALTHTRPEMYDLGIDPSTAKRRITNIIEAANECENALVAGEDIFRLHLLKKQENLQNQICEVNTTLEKKRDVWPEKRVNDLEESKNLLEEKLGEIQSLLRKDDAKSVEKIRRAAKRRADSLINENRVKRRKLGAGRASEIDEDEEQFLLKAIEEMSTSHGRRHDTVMYLHHRVKSKDMLAIVNHRRHAKGKKPLKAVSTVLARGKPKRINSIQAKRHMGQSLFCCKKPPKTEDTECELTHHQRAHVRNAVANFCFTEEDRKYALIKSIDDKAYVRPGTSVGFRDVKRGGIFQPSDSEAARKLPKYDWVKKEVYVTPSTHRIFNKEPKTFEDGTEKYVMNEDESFVFMRPKAYVGSSGTVWSSEDHELSASRPDLYEVSGSDFSLPFRSICARVKHKLKHFIQTTTEVDVKVVSLAEDCEFRSYEKRRLEHTAGYLEGALAKTELLKMSEAEVGEYIKIRDMVRETLKDMNNLSASTNTGSELWDEYVPLINSCEQIMATFDGLELPTAKSHVLELTDAGPGVGCNNLAVKFRMAETILIHNLDKVVRVHRAHGDSGQNEAERTNASIGEALVTGDTLEWEHFKRFEGLSQEEIDAMSLQDYEQLEVERMKKNAWRAASELADRVDGEPAPSGFITCRVTPNESEQFLWDQEYMERYLACKSESGKLKLPGHGYYSTVEQFCDLHFDQGELYLEFVKGSCENKGNLCDFCKVWSGPRTDCVPRPYPNYDQPGFHYLAARDTPIRDKEGNARPVDDFQPRAQLKQQFINGVLTSSHANEISNFSKKYIVPENLVRSYLAHIEQLELFKQKRQREDKAKKTAQNAKKFEDYNWNDLYQQRKLSTLRVLELDKYIIHHNLSAMSKKMKKKDKISLMEAHIAMRNFPIQDKELVDLESEDDEIEEDDNDTVLCEWGTEQEEEEVEVFCICRQPEEDDRFMICCDECDEWFHADCLTMSDEELETYKNNPEVEFVCPFCK